MLSFEKQRIDYIGPVHLNSSHNMACIMLVVDYFNTLVEAKAVKVADKKTLVSFMFENIIAQYGIPQVLISNRGIHFLNDLIE